MRELENLVPEYIGTKATAEQTVFLLVAREVRTA